MNSIVATTAVSIAATVFATFVAACAIALTTGAASVAIVAIAFQLASASLEIVTAKHTSNCPRCNLAEHVPKD